MVDDHHSNTSSPLSDIPEGSTYAPTPKPSTYSTEDEDPPEEASRRVSKKSCRRSEEPLSALRSTSPRIPKTARSADQSTRRATGIRDDDTRQPTSTIYCSVPDTDKATDGPKMNSTSIVEDQQKPRAAQGSHNVAPSLSRRRIMPKTGTRGQTESSREIAKPLSMKPDSVRARRLYREKKSGGSTRRWTDDTANSTDTKSLECVIAALGRHIAFGESEGDDRTRIQALLNGELDAHKVVTSVMASELDKLREAQRGNAEERLKSAYDTLEKSYQQVVQQLTVCRTQLNVANSEKEKLKSNWNNSNSHSAAPSSQLPTFRKRNIAPAPKVHSGLSNSVEPMMPNSLREAQLTDLRSQNSMLTSQVNMLKADKATLTSQLTEKESQVANLKHHISRMFNEGSRPITEHSKQISELKSVMAKKEDEWKKKEDTYKQEKTQTRAIVRDMRSRLEHSADAFKEEKARLQATVDELQEEIRLFVRK